MKLSIGICKNCQNQFSYYHPPSFGGKKYCNRACMFKDQEYRLKHKKNSLKMWTDHTFKERMKVISQSEQWVKKQSEATKKRFENKEYREQHRNKMKKYFENPANRLKASILRKKVANEMSEIHKKKNLSEETLRKMSLSMTRRLSGQKFFVRGRRSIINNVHLKSSYETAFALYLNDQNVKWEYEKTHYLLSNNKYYTPDFFIGNQIFETKGYWTAKARQKFDLFREEYPNKNIKVLMHEQLKMILAKYSHLIKEVADQ